MRLFPYRYSIARDAHELGWPMMRHLLLHFPEDRNVYRIGDQFMLGPSFIVAPILEEGARERSVYLPAGYWFAFEGGARLEGGQIHSVRAELDEIPVFVRAGALIPMLRELPDTLAPSTEGGIVDGRNLDGAALTVRVYLGAEGRFRMYDDTRFHLSYADDPLEIPGIVVDQQRLESCANAASRDCVVVDGPRQLTVRLSSRPALSLVATEGETVRFALTVDGPVTRELELVIHW